MKVHLPTPLGMVASGEVMNSPRCVGDWGDRAGERGKGPVRPRRKAASRRRGLGKCPKWSPDQQEEGGLGGHWWGVHGSGVGRGRG